MNTTTTQTKTEIRNNRKRKRKITQHIAFEQDEEIEFVRGASWKTSTTHNTWNYVSHKVEVNCFIRLNQSYEMEATAGYELSNLWVQSL